VPFLRRRLRREQPADPQVRLGPLTIGIVTGARLQADLMHRRSG
jgi:hypothetical protein